MREGRVRKGGVVKKGREKKGGEEGRKGTERFWVCSFLFELFDSYVWCFALPLCDIFLVKKYGA